MTAPTGTGNQLVDLLNNTEVYRFADCDESTLTVLAVAEELRTRLIMAFTGDLAAAHVAAAVVDEYAREQVDEFNDRDDDGCNCEGYGCQGKCCGIGRCSCTPGFLLAVELTMAIDAQTTPGSEARQ